MKNPLGRPPSRHASDGLSRPRRSSEGSQPAPRLRHPPTQSPPTPGFGTLPTRTGSHDFSGCPSCRWCRKGNHESDRLGAPRAAAAWAARRPVGRRAAPRPMSHGALRLPLQCRPTEGCPRACKPVLTASVSTHRGATARWPGPAAPCDRAGNCAKARLREPQLRGASLSGAATALCAVVACLLALTGTLRLVSVTRLKSH